MCTSTNTTSGVRSRIISIAASTSEALPTHVDVIAELGAHAGEKQLVIVDEKHARGAHVVTASVDRGIDISTSVPSPFVERTSPVPPARASRSTMEPEIPRRSSATSSGIEACPRSRTKIDTRWGSTSR